MRHAIVLCLLLASGCTFSDIAPDSFTLGASHTRYDLIGVEWRDTGDRFVNDDGKANTVSAFLTWNFGPGRARPDEDWDRLEGAMIRMAAELAKALPRPEGTKIIVNPATVETPAEVHGPPPEPAHEHDALGWLEWYGRANLFVQVLIAGLVLAALVTMVLMRKTLVQLLRMAAFWRAKEAPKNNDNGGGGGKGSKGKRPKGQQRGPPEPMDTS